MNPVGVAAELAILRLHQQEFEVIWGSKATEGPLFDERLLPRGRCAFADATHPNFVGNHRQWRGWA